jgi:hypothetical protein
MRRYDHMIVFTPPNFENDVANYLVNFDTNSRTRSPNSYMTDGVYEGISEHNREGLAGQIIDIVELDFEIVKKLGLQNNYTRMNVNIEGPCYVYLHDFDVFNLRSGMAFVEQSLTLPPKELGIGVFKGYDRERGFNESKLKAISDKRLSSMVHSYYSPPTRSKLNPLNPSSTILKEDILFTKSNVDMYFSSDINTNYADYFDDGPYDRDADWSNYPRDVYYNY